MSDKKKTNKTTITGISFSGLLTIAFIVLKLCGVINWSWFWVLSPVIISTGIGLLIIIFALGLCLLNIILTAIFE